MPIRWWPRTIRWQMLVSLIILEAVSLALFVAAVVFFGNREVQLRTHLRLERELSVLGAEGREALVTGNLYHLRQAVKEMGQDPSVAIVRVTDSAGHVLYSSQGEGDRDGLSVMELEQIPRSTSESANIFLVKDWWGEGVQPIYSGGVLRGFIWISAKQSWNLSLLYFLLNNTAFLALLWMAASLVLVGWISRYISRPLAMLRASTRILIQEPGRSGDFPLVIPASNEIGELIEAFNQMVATQTRQREGLDDTLSLLDSMLVNAPVGLVFFDPRSRFVRINPIFAQLCDLPVQRFGGRALAEIFSPETVVELDGIVQQVFSLEEPLHNLEVNGNCKAGCKPWTWLVSAYPVRTGQRHLRWVGMIVMDITERKKAQETLRKTEKLAATGRLAASVAHEINNPLEALSNLLYLLHNFCKLEGDAAKYVEMAEHEAQRIAEITQQTLRFFRQSTWPSRSNMAELLDAVLALDKGRIQSLNLQVERRYDPMLDLFCFSGELRQVFANLVGNALDASKPDGRLLVRARRSHNWKNLNEPGVRFSIADTGYGMVGTVREQIFEAFFTTKEATGTGLGLWVSQEIILKHRGMVHVRSRPERGDGKSGTVFQLFIPDDQNLLENLNRTKAEVRA